MFNICTGQILEIMNRARLLLLCGITAVGLTISSAGATLIEKDLNAPGDKLLTLDTLTGLEWLDVDATLHLSYNDALLTPFVTAQNFRHANQNEVAALYSGNGVTDQTSTYTAADFLGVQNIIEKLGCVGDCVNFPKQYGWTDLVPFSLTIAGLPFVQYSTFLSTAQSGNTSPAFSPCGGGCGKDLGGPQVEIGNYLVRPVPEPSTSALLLGGLAGWVAFRLRRDREGRLR